MLAMILARAPLRISLGGGGTDLPSYYREYGGFFVSAAINKYVYIYVNRPAADDYIRVKYSKYEQVKEVKEIQHDLVRPSLELLGIDGQLEIVSMADVPAGTGLGSSGSYLVALLTALYTFRRSQVPTHALAEMACHIEIDLAKHPVGKQDQYIAAFGGITCFEVDKNGRVGVTPLDVSVEVVEELRNNLLLFYTGITRRSRDILADQQRDTEKKARNVLDSLHFTKELGYRIKEALEGGNVEEFGLMMDEHWQHKKRRSEKISDPLIDRCYEAAREAGALGGKVIGAGGGGFLMLYCPAQDKADIRKSLAEHDLREMYFDFDFEGAKVLVNF